MTDFVYTVTDPEVIKKELLELEWGHLQFFGARLLFCPACQAAIPEGTFTDGESARMAHINWHYRNQQILKALQLTADSAKRDAAAAQAEADRAGDFWRPIG